MPPPRELFAHAAATLENIPEGESTAKGENTAEGHFATPLYMAILSGWAPVP